MALEKTIKSEVQKDNGKIKRSILACLLIASVMISQMTLGIFAGEIDSGDSADSSAQTWDSKTADTNDNETAELEVSEVTEHEVSGQADVPAQLPNAPILS